ncbi:MAG TPA: IRE (iron responsive element), partial [Pirellulales bacterium]|nr:IRE (iron responsive element) [Pirellulales bacterium]
MNQTAFFHKVVYLGLMALLLLPLYWLSQPSTTATAEQPGSPGGALAQKREEFKLGQASLGKIDPAGETIRLATLGMRGIAANILWAKADEYKMKEDWTNLSATLEQIAYLQPNYIGVWQHQSWNLSYNVSYEFDDYHQRYACIIKGIEYLQKGIEYNSNDPRLLSGVGWFASNKIGTADEHLQFRRLFREDDDFHRRQKIQQRDNWLFGKAYFLEAQR